MSYLPPPAQAQAQAQPAQAQAQLLPPPDDPPLPLLTVGLLSAVGIIAAAIPPMVVSAQPAKEAETSPKVVVEVPLPLPDAVELAALGPLPEAELAVWRAHAGQ